MNQIQNNLQNRSALKLNYIIVEETGKIYADRGGDQGLMFDNKSIRTKLLNGDFDNTVTVFVSGVNGQSGPNIKPSKKALQRMFRIIRHTTYRVVQQCGQNFT